jgi:hypothetical protein
VVGELGSRMGRGEICSRCKIIVICLSRGETVSYMHAARNRREDRGDFRVHKSDKEKPQVIEFLVSASLVLAAKAGLLGSNSQPPALTLQKPL